MFRQGNPNGGIFTSSKADKDVPVVALYLGLKLSIDAPMFSTIKGSGSLDEHDAWSAVRFTSVGGGARLGGDPDKSGSESRKYEFPNREWIYQKKNANKWDRQRDKQ